VHEEGEYAAPVAAARAGVPWVTHGWGSPLQSARELAEIEDLTSAVWKSCGRDVRAAAGLYAHALVNPCPPMLQDQPPPGASVVWPIRPRLLDGRGPALEAGAYIGFGLRRPPPRLMNFPDVAAISGVSPSVQYEPVRLSDEFEPRPGALTGLR
jgi:hypothetical protein